MRILYNCALGGGWDQRTDTRDVSVVTRQPLLLELLRQGHEIIFTQKPVAPKNMSLKAITLSDGLLNSSIVNRWSLVKDLFSLNERRVKELDSRIKIVNVQSRPDLKDVSCDFAITELRSRLYFHDSFPLDAKRQEWIWQKYPTLIWDLDLWSDAYHHFIGSPENDRDFANASVITPSEKWEYANPPIFDHCEIPSHHFDFAVDTEVAELCFNIDILDTEQDVDLGYLGSQYNREDSFLKYFKTASEEHEDFNTAVFGHWYHNVIDQCPKIKFSEVRTPAFMGPAHLNSFKFTMQILPKYYQITGHHTYRFFEGQSCGPILFCDGNIRGSGEHVSRKRLVYTIDDWLEALEEATFMSAGERMDCALAQLEFLGFPEKNTWAERAKELVDIAKDLGVG